MYPISASKVLWSQNYKMLPENNVSFSRGGESIMVAVAIVLRFDTSKFSQIMLSKFRLYGEEKLL